MKKLYKVLLENMGIRWRLVILFASITILSGGIIGYTSYYNAEEIALSQIRNQLSNQAEDWKRLIDSYVEEINGIEEIEDTIMKSYLGNISLNIQNWIRFTEDIYGGDNTTPQYVRNKIYNNIANIEIGKTGYTWVLGGQGEKKGSYIVSKNRKRDGENLWNECDERGFYFVQQIYKNTPKTEGRFYTLSYHWDDENGVPQKKVAAVTYYEPWDIYIGASAYYKDYVELEYQMKERLKNKIAEQVIGKTGYIFILQGSGENKGRYIVSRNRKRDGEDIWNSKDADGKYFIQDIVNKGKETPSEAYIITYTWQNIGEEVAAEKIAAITYVREWDWVLGASAYHKDFLDPVVLLRRRAIRITYVSAIAAIIIAFLIGTYYAKTLTTPLKKLTKIALNMGQPDLHHKSEEPIRATTKEISTLIAAIEKAKKTQLELDRTEKEKTILIKELEAKNMELERFTYTVSHDLRSPLVTIKGFLGIFKEEFEQENFEKLDSYIQRIEKASDTMQELLSDLLELSRIGRMINPSKDIDFNKLISDVIELLVVPIENRGVEMVVQKDIPNIFADRQRMMEVMQNLIENAIKYMGNQKSPLIEIGYSNNGSENIYFVKDNGIGIDMKYKEKIFDLFDQLDKHAEGTGVGLALVKRIVEFHQGRIWFESDGKDRGTTFYFTLGEQKNEE